jgi:hypothetical protein
VVNSGEGNSVDATWTNINGNLQIASLTSVAITSAYSFAGSQLVFGASNISGLLDIQAGVETAGATSGEALGLIETKGLVALVEAADPRADGVNLNLNLTSTSQAPLFYQLAIPDLLDARMSSRETAIHLSPRGDEALAVDLAYEERVAVDADGTPREIVVVASKCKEVMQEGEFRFLRDSHTLAVEIDGAGIREFQTALITAFDWPALDAAGSPAVVPNSGPLAFAVPLVATVELSDVRIIDSTPRIEMLHRRQRLLLSDVELIDSDLSIENRLRATQPGDRPSLLVVYDDVTVGGASRLSHVVQGTPEGDTVLIGGNALVEQDGQFEMLVDTGAGPDQVFLVLDLAGSTGSGSIRVFTGDDDDKAVAGIFRGEEMQRLFAELDTGTGADRALASRNFTVRNTGDPVERPGRRGRDDADDRRGGLEGYLDGVRNLLLSEHFFVPRFERLEAATYGRGLFRLFLDDSSD